MMMVKNAPHGSKFTFNFWVLVLNLFLTAQYSLLIEERIDLNQVTIRYF